MSLVKRDNSRFWYVQFQINHRTVIRSTKTTEKRVAEQVAARIRAEVHAEHMLGRKEPITLEQALQRFVDTKIGTANHRNLVSQKRLILTAIDGSILLPRITSSTLEEFRRRRTPARVWSPDGQAWAAPYHGSVEVGAEGWVPLSHRGGSDGQDREHHAEIPDGRRGKAAAG